MKQQRIFKIRDLRHKEKFVVDDSYMNGYVKVIGKAGSLIYFCLCRHANKEQEAWPAQETMAKRIGLSVRSVRDGLKRLRDTNIIEIDRERTAKGKWLNNIYILLDKTQWKKPEAVQALWRSQRQKETKTKGSQRPIKETQVKETHILVDKKLSTYQQFINFFYEITKKTRGIKPIITGKDGKNLKRVLKLNILSSTELEQLALYFLANSYYKKFAPSVSTFLSSGILNGLANSLKNREEFWKELDGYTQRYFQDSPEIKRSDHVERKIIEVREKIGVWKK